MIRTKNLMPSIEQKLNYSPSGLPSGYGKGTNVPSGRYILISSSSLKTNEDRNKASVKATRASS